VVNQGALNLISPSTAIGTPVATNVVIPAGGLTLNGGTVTMLTNQGQIESTNVVTLNGPSALNSVGDNTLNSLVYNNNGGTSQAVATGGILTLTNSTPVTVTSTERRHPADPRRHGQSRQRHQDLQHRGHRPARRDRQHLVALLERHG